MTYQRWCNCLIKYQENARQYAAIARNARDAGNLKMAIAAQLHSEFWSDCVVHWLGSPHPKRPEKREPMRKQIERLEARIRELESAHRNSSA